MRTLTITAADLKDGEYTGELTVDFDGRVEIEAGLGTVRVRESLSARGHIRAGSGTGILAGEGISAGYGISAGWGISAGRGISAGWGISAGRGISAGLRITALWLRCRLRIFAGLYNRRALNPTEDVIVGEVREGTVALGTLLLPSDFYDAGKDSRGYQFLGFRINGQWRVIAGCRNYALAEAREHWGVGGESDREDCRALVEKIAAHGSKEPVTEAVR